MLANITIANVLISLISFVGVVFVSNKKLLTGKIVQYLVSFAAGVMLSTAFLNILPEALETGEVKEVLSYALGGMVFGFFLERFLLWYHHHHEDMHNVKPISLLVLIGDGIHNFVDGVAIAATFLVNPALGISTAIAVAAHEIPQEFADFSVLIHCGFSSRKALVLNFLSALMAVLGGIFGFYFLLQFQSYVPLAIALAAGIFIYIASADLIPELHRTHKKGELFEQVLPFTLGILIMVFLSQVLVESH